MPRIRNVHSTGTSVTARMVEPNIAKVLVNASGWNIFPSMPVRANTGTNARMMITIAKKIGRPTSLAAFSVISQICSR